MDRRLFLKGAILVAAAPAVLVPERKIWQVPSSAPVTRTPGMIPSRWARLYERTEAARELGPEPDHLDAMLYAGAAGPGKTEALDKELLDEFARRYRPFTKPVALHGGAARPGKTEALRLAKWYERVIVVRERVLLINPDGSTAEGLGFTFDYGLRAPTPAYHEGEG